MLQAMRRPWKDDCAGKQPGVQGKNGCSRDQRREYLDRAGSIVCHPSEPDRALSAHGGTDSDVFFLNLVGVDDVAVLSCGSLPTHLATTIRDQTTWACLRAFCSLKKWHGVPHAGSRPALVGSGPSPAARDSPTKPLGADIGGTSRSGVMLRRHKSAPIPLPRLGRRMTCSPNFTFPFVGLAVSCQPVPREGQLTNAGSRRPENRVGDGRADRWRARLADAGGCLA